MRERIDRARSLSCGGDNLVHRNDGGCVPEKIWMVNGGDMEKNHQHI